MPSEVIRVVLKRPEGTVVFKGRNGAQVGIAVAAFLRELGQPSKGYPPSPLSPWDEFVSRVVDKPGQLRVLQLLKDKGDHTLPQLTAELGAEGTLEMGGLLGAIRRTTLRSGFASTEDVIRKKGAVFTPGPALKDNELPVYRDPL